MLEAKAEAAADRAGASWASYWGVGGIFAILGEALYRLTPRALDPLLSGELSVPETAFYAVTVASMALGEGYVGFQRNFSPRAVARAFQLNTAPRSRQLLAPLYCMGLLYATRRRLIINWALTLGIVALVFLVRLLPQPWRNIVDAGVVAGLLWGTVATVALFAQALSGRVPRCDLEHPIASTTT